MITPPVCPHVGDVQEIQVAPGRLFLCPDTSLSVCAHLLLRTINNNRI